MAHSEKRLLIPPVSPAAAGPLYEQIVAGVKREIAEGRLSPGDSLPSFRKLAEDLMVSVITVKRAYEELEREGIIFRRQGLGTFVSEDGAERTRRVKEQQVRKLLEEAVREAADAGMDERKLLEMMKNAVKKGDPS